MSFSEVMGRIGEPNRRRAIRLIAPRVQLTLAAYLILISVAFGVLEVFNSWSAYASLSKSTLSFAPPGLRQDILDQTQVYLHTSLALLAGFVFAILGVSIGYLNRLLGPNVALERFLRSLRSGNYSERVKLRSDDALHAELGNQLNQLAAQLEALDRSRDA